MIGFMGWVRPITKDPDAPDQITKRIDRWVEKG